MEAEYADFRFLFAFAILSIYDGEIGGIRMAEQTFIGVLEKHEPETFVFVTVDLESGHAIRRMQFATEDDLRKKTTFDSVEIVSLITQGRNNPIK